MIFGAQLIGGVIGIWWLSMFINFCIIKIKKYENKRTRLIATILAVIFAEILWILTSPSGQNVSGSISYLVGGIIIYFSYVRQKTS